MENKLVVGILNIVEDKLREFNVQLPDDMREDSNDPIVGFHYAELHDRIQEYLEEQGVFSKDGTTTDIAAFRKRVKAINEFERSILNQLEERGVDVGLLSLDVLHYIDDEHQYCVWYGGPVAMVEYKGYTFSLEAHGDVICSLLDDNGNEVLHVTDKGNEGGFYHVMKDEIDNDTEFDCLCDEGHLVLNANNWFEVFIEDPHGERSLISEVCNSDNLEECILEMVESMDLMIADVEAQKYARIKPKTMADWPAGVSIDKFLRVGDIVDEEMYMHFLNIAPPRAFGSGLLQVGGACDTIKNEDGKLQNTFLTFVKAKDHECWIFKGECFAHEWINRNPDLEPGNAVDALISDAQGRAVNGLSGAGKQDLELGGI